MALTLSAELAAAQETTEDRHPIVDIISSQWTDALPFYGSYLNDNVSGELYPNAIAHSTGPITGVYTRDNTSGDSQYLHYFYSDEDRAIFVDEIIYDAGNYSIQGASIVELANGDLGIVFNRDWLTTGTTYLTTMVINLSGETVAGPSDIGSFAESSYWVGEPHVVQFSGENYFLSYPHSDINANDGSGEYSLQYRTSSDFSSWTAAGEMDISGELLDTSRRGHPFVVAPDTGDMVIYFDYVDERREDGVEIINIYKASSSDYGATWTSGEQITTLDEYGTAAKNPSAVVNSSGDMRLAYHLETAVLTMDTSTGGWCSSSQGAAGTACTNHSPTALSFDPATRKLFLYVTGTVTPISCSVIVVDVDSWTIDDCFSDSTTPGYDELFSDHSTNLHRNLHSNGPYFGAHSRNPKASFVYNLNTDTFKQYFFETHAPHDVVKNIDVDWRGYTPTLEGTYLDGTTGRFYHLFVYNSYNPNLYWVGYVDVNEDVDGATGKYTWREINYWNEGGGYNAQIQAGEINSFVVDTSIDMFFISSSYMGSLGLDGDLKVRTLSSGSEVRHYTNSDYSGFVKQGVRRPVYANGFLYCTFPYESRYGQQDRRGILRIQLSTNQMTYITPPYGGGIDDYGLMMNRVTSDQRIIWNTYNYGTWIYDTDDGSWTEYSNSTLPGFTPSGTDYLGSWAGLAYDEDNGIIFTGKYWNIYYAWEGLIAFSEAGSFRQMKYRDVTWDDSNWVVGSESSLTLNLNDYAGTITVDEDDAYWLFWVRLDGTERSIKWANTGVQKTLSDYITGTVEAEWAIDSPNQLTFSLSDGHRFDPMNLLSAWSVYLRRGRRLTLRFGEKISGVDYWQNQGQFIVEETHLSYTKGTYPIISVTAYDRRFVWNEQQVPATEYYDDAYPEYILTQLLENHASLSSDDYDIPSDGSMTGSHKIYHQWIDMNLMEILQEILDHFGYSHFYDVDGDFSIRYVDFEGSVDHFYTDNTRLLDFTINDSYGSFINRVTVKGEGRYFLEVLYNEERVHIEHGTAGWWGVTEIKRHYYDEDEKQTCRNPRLVILESPTISIGFIDKGGGSIRITDEDTGETWVQVTIRCPNLIGELFVSIAAAAATGAAALGCDASKSCGTYIFALSVELEIISLILGCVAQYRYEIWAQPVGHEKQTFQASADDLELQNELNGMIIPQEIDDPFCYSLGNCQSVATREMLTIMGQRKRTSFTKIAHLQDEITDIIEVPHPYSGQPLRYMIATLRRVFEKSTGPDGGGKFEDQIEGWKTF